jgi:hypothetical protein
MMAAWMMAAWMMISLHPISDGTCYSRVPNTIEVGGRRVKISTRWTGVNRHGMCKRPEAFRGQANQEIYSNLFLVTAVLPRARIDIIGKATSCTNTSHASDPLPVYVVAWMTSREQPSQYSLQLQKYFILILFGAVDRSVNDYTVEIPSKSTLWCGSRAGRFSWVNRSRPVVSITS